MQNELEIKCQIKEGSDIDTLKSILHSIGFEKVSEEKQLNHYFSNPHIEMAKNYIILDRILKSISVSLDKLNKNLFPHLKNSCLSIRTRYTEGKNPLLCIKSNNSDATNGDDRFESEFKLDMIYRAELSSKNTRLDNLLDMSGFKIQSKWSREREVWKSTDKNLTVCIDKNAGYGYVVELEKILEISTEDNAPELESLKSLADSLNLVELDKDKLKKMFEFYSKNWADYYQTDKTFTV